MATGNGRERFSPIHILTARLATCRRACSLTSTEQDRRVADERRGSKGIQDVWASAAKESLVQDAKGAFYRQYWLLVRAVLQEKSDMSGTACKRKVRGKGASASCLQCQKGAINDVAMFPAGRDIA